MIRDCRQRSWTIACFRDTFYYSYKRVIQSKNQSAREGGRLTLNSLEVKRLVESINWLGRATRADDSLEISVEILLIDEIAPAISTTSPLSDSFYSILPLHSYAADARYAELNQGITHAQCWVHSRRQFIKAEEQAPESIRRALDFIAALYRIEAQITEQKLTGDGKQQYRQAHSKVVVDSFFAWCEEQLRRADLTPSNPFLKALGYVMTREHKLRVFLEDPDVPLDTNHLERALRAIPMGRNSWLFSWTELGAEHVGNIQSLIATCRLHNINPYTYLTDVPLRMSEHPASRVEELTPRLWKTQFAGNPLRSALSHVNANVSSGE